MPQLTQDEKVCHFGLEKVGLLWCTSCIELYGQIWLAGELVEKLGVSTWMQMKPICPLKRFRALKTEKTKWYSHRQKELVQNLVPRNFQGVRIEFMNDFCHSILKEYLMGYRWTFFWFQTSVSKSLCRGWLHVVWSVLLLLLLLLFLLS